MATMAITTDIAPITNPLKGFFGETVQLVETIALFVLASSTPCTASIMVDFLVVKSPSSYNTIISKPTLNSLKAITYTYHLKMKFSTSQGVKEIQGE